MARIRRDQRYWSQRRGSARVVEPASGVPDAARFGTTVTLRLAAGAERAFKIVGEDEADPARGLVSWVSPLGRALTGQAVGDEVAVAGQPAEVVGLSA